MWTAWKSLAVYSLTPNLLRLRHRILVELDLLIHLEGSCEGLMRLYVLGHEFAKGPST